MKTRLGHRVLFVLPLVVFSSLLADASALRTYVSVNGNDMNTGSSCAVNAPCRSFGAAQTVTSPRGEIVAVDTGDYMPVTITQSVTIKAAPGVDATIVAQFGDAITVNAGSSDIVVVRGLTLNGGGSGMTGVHFFHGNLLYVENCVIDNFNNDGITMGGAGSLRVKDSVIRNGVEGIRLQSSSGLIHAVIDHVTIQNNMFSGIFAAENSQTTVRDSTLADNGQYGVQVGDFSGTSELNMENSVVQGSFNGIFAGAGGGGSTTTVRVSQSTIIDNNQGLMALSGAQLLSYGNNRLSGNMMDGFFTGSILLH